MTELLRASGRGVDGVVLLLLLRGVVRRRGVLSLLAWVAIGVETGRRRIMRWRVLPVVLLRRRSIVLLLAIAWLWWRGAILLVSSSIRGLAVLLRRRCAVGRLPVALLRWRLAVASVLWWVLGMAVTAAATGSVVALAGKP